MSSVSCYRIVEHQSKIYEYNATTSEEHAVILEELIENTKPQPYFKEWHDLIATPFRYSLPVGADFEARFRPRNSMTNTLYASKVKVTTFYEHAYHFLKFRANLKKVKKTGQRTVFALEIANSNSITDISNEKNIASIIDPNNYSASHNFIEKNPKLKVIKFPSCRDPEHRPNYCVRDINELKKDIHDLQTVSFAYDKKAYSIKWLELDLVIPWNIFGVSASNKPPSTKSKRKAQQ